MTTLSTYSAFRGDSNTSPTISQIPEKLLKSYTIANGVATVSINDACFSLSTYKAIHVRGTNITMSGTAQDFCGLPYKNGAIVSGSYTYTRDNPTSATATGWGTSSITTLANSPLTASIVATAQPIGQLDCYLTTKGMTATVDVYNTTNSQRNRSTYCFPSFPVSFTSTDYIGMILGFSSTGTFTGGTIDVYGEI